MRGHGSQYLLQNQSPDLSLDKGAYNIIFGPENVLLSIENRHYRDELL